MPDLLAAAVAGVLAAQPMEVPVYLQKAFGLPVRQDIFAEAGAMLRVPARLRRTAGWIAHAATGAAVAVLYALFFAAVNADDRFVLWGLLAGVVHFAVGGVVVGGFPLLHPDMARPTPPPGVFYRHYGRLDVVTFLGGHLLFGVLVGVLYAVLARGA